MRGVGRKPVRVASLALTALLAAGCSDAPAGPGEEGPSIEELFTAPTPSEVAAVEAEWAGRDPGAEGVQVEHEEDVTLAGSPATLTVLSHLVDGYRHYGAVVTPSGAADGSLPLVVYAHGGDGGVSVGELLTLASVAGPDAAGVVWVAPSFRSEPLEMDDRSWLSEGPASPWDRDVDDALALVDAALETTPAADPERIGVVGLSRGAGVALLMGVRDPAVDLVVEFFGPTDFFGSYVRDIVEDVVAGDPPELPGVDVLSALFIEPWSAGTLATAAVRLELARRSPVLFAERLPDVQIHHGTADAVVDVSQAQALIAALQAAGRGLPADEWFIYEGGGHNPLTLSGSLSRTVAFLERLTGGGAAVAPADAPTGAVVPPARRR